MITVVQVASYICERFQKDFGHRIDEMKLHKLLYFMQRECIVQTGEPLFDSVFHAWEYGPVIPEIRSLYKSDSLHQLPSEEDIKKYQTIFDTVFSEYAASHSLTLSSITHGELSWQRARIGYAKYDDSDEPMSLSDIREDAERFKQRCLLLKLREERMKIKN